MNYTIEINQFAGEKHFPDLDIIDLAIFDYIRKFYPSTEKYTDTLGVWFWISHKKIIDDMPKLKIKSKAGIIKRVNNLIDVGIIDRHPNIKNIGRSYYKVGAKWDLLTKFTPSQQESTPPINENQEGGINENQEDYNTIIDNNTNDSIINWRNDFEKYKSDLREVYETLINDPVFIKERETFHPNLNIKQTLRKACIDYWSTKEAWQKRKKSKYEINWKRTLTNALTSKMNQVWKERNAEQPTHTPSSTAPSYYNTDLENYGK